MAQSRGEQIATELAGRIVKGDIAPGERLPSEAKLTAEFDASRSVVREALQRLQTQGYVRTRTGSGSYALTPPRSVGDDDWLSAKGPAERAELHAFRTAIEQEAASLAARRRADADLAAMDDALARLASASLPAETVDADFAFHRAVAAASGNRFLLEAIDRIGARAIVLPEARIAAAERDPAAAAVVTAEHAAVADAIRAGDPTAAAAAMRAHLFASAKRRDAA
ncbi:FadR/GntR family transcriptional regulator [Microbacterium halophytorum]|uniref:FadR/GntR family transcriptional regulator n=1 Tax=Microbacterium halophytorum TaxID=2067568 RepID=UPI000CFDFD68|nr:FCD domain-containing protein [Microbacterium halophytorum]